MERKTTSSRSVNKITTDKISPSVTQLTTSLTDNNTNSPTVEVTEEARNLIKKECDKQGVTLEFLVGVIKTSCKATKLVQDKYGQVIAEEPEYQTQLKAAMSAFELRGELKTKDNSGGTTNNFFDVKALMQQWKGVK